MSTTQPIATFSGLASSIHGRTWWTRSSRRLRPHDAVGPGGRRHPGEEHRVGQPEERPPGPEHGGRGPLRRQCVRHLHDGPVRPRRRETCTIDGHRRRRRRHRHLLFHRDRVPRQPREAGRQGLRRTYQCPGPFGRFRHQRRRREREGHRHAGLHRPAHQRRR